MDYQTPLAQSVKVAQKIIIYHPKEVNKFLLLKRSAEKLDLPGGNLSPTELHEESLRREIKEETSLEVGEINPTEIQSNIQKTGAYFLYIGYCAKALTSKVKIPEQEDNQEFEWITIEALKTKYANSALMPLILRQAQKAHKIIFE